jgi:2,4-dienoyl-CoA reductase-like NADH-dependent reductase (Old Yellow Enzyme family)
MLPALRKNPINKFNSSQLFYAQAAEDFLRDPLLKPLEIKNMVLKNRLFSTSHAPNFGSGIRHVLYHEEKAKGGISLTMFGGSTAVSRDGIASFGTLDASCDSIIHGMEQLAKAVHKHGAYTMCQLTHMGRRTGYDSGDWFPPIAPSSVREEENRSFPKEMEEEDIKRVIQDFAKAALRCKIAGLDGVEIMASHLHLVDQFWSPHVNVRTDQYGGSLLNRMRFSLEVLEAVRAAVGDDFVVGVRMSGDEELEVGNDEMQSIEIAKILSQSGLIDYINVLGGNANNMMSTVSIVPNMDVKSAPHVKLAGKFKNATKLPIFHAGKIQDVATARWAIKEGLVDMVGMTRAHIADPHIMEKVMKGEEHRIRPCVGASYCIDRIYMGKDAVCIQNAASGREYLGIPHKIPKAKLPLNVVIVGGGPAGLEAARVCASRGHKVRLYEANNKLGGQINLATQVKWRTSLKGIIDYLESECSYLGVDVKLDSWAEKEDLDRLEPDIIIISTGGTPNVSFLDTLRKGGSEHVVSTWDILGGSVRPTEGPILVYDENGNIHAPSCAEFIVKELGITDVELVTIEKEACRDVGSLNQASQMKHLYECNIKITPNYKLEKVEKLPSNEYKATFRNEFSGHEMSRVVKLVVVEHGAVPADELYFQLKPHSTNLGQIDHAALLNNHPQELNLNPKGKFKLFRVGDSVSSRNLHTAVYDSLRLCKDL